MGDPMDPYGRYGESPSEFHTCCEKGSLNEVYRRLIDLRSDGVDDRDYRGRTPLHAAVESQQIEVAQFLLIQGANIDATCVGDGKTALHMACSLLTGDGINNAVVLMLLERGAKHDAVCEKGFTALHYAAASDAPEEIITRLIELGVDVNTRDKIGQTPLMIAAGAYVKWNVEKMELKMQLLLGAGADINAHANNGYTAIHMACQSHNHSGAKFLLSNGADPCSKNKNGHTAFSFGHVRENDRLVANCRECEDLKLAHCEELRSRNAVLERSALSMTSLLFSDDLSDVEVVCGGDCERIPAHRCILAACSQPLRASLLGPWAESAKKEVEMSQSGAAVRVLLRFMYTGEAEAAALDDNLHEVLELAALYDLADLKAACEERRIMAVASSCDIDIVEKIEKLRSRSAVLERLAISMTSLLSSDGFSDVEVVCGDGEHIPAHRCILAACSQPLRASLLGPWAESAKREVEMSQSGAAVRVLLRFMYTCEAEAAALDDNLHEVLELAALYDLADLKAACEERCLAGLQIETVVQLRDTASHHNLKKVAKACIRYMNENMVQLEDLGLVVVYKLRDEVWTKTSPHGVKRAASEIYEIYDASED